MSMMRHRVTRIRLLHMAVIVALLLLSAGAVMSRARAAGPGDSLDSASRPQLESLTGSETGVLDTAPSGGAQPADDGAPAPTLEGMDSTAVANPDDATTPSASNSLFHGPYELQNWTHAGPGSTGINPPQGPAYTAVFTYNSNPSSYNWETWVYSTTAAASERLDFSWSYTGQHSWSSSEAQAFVFADGPNGRATTTLYSGTGGWGFKYSGLSFVQVNAGYAFGFITKGKHYDSSRILRGSLTITGTSEIGTATPTPTSTRTATATATRTATPMPSSTLTASPSPTATATRTATRTATASPTSSASATRTPIDGAASGLFFGPYELQNWAKSGPGLTSIDPVQGPAYTAVFTYNNSPSSFNWETWVFSTTATTSEGLNFMWQYKYCHSWSDVFAQAFVFADGPSGRTTTTLYNYSGPGSCDTGVGGNGSVQVNAGYSFGFIAKGKHYDGSRILRGSLTITGTGALGGTATPTPTATNSATPTSTSSATATRTATPANTATSTATASRTATRTATPTMTPTVVQGIMGLTASNNGPTRLNEATTLTANVATGVDVSYAWAFGDGVTATGRIVTHTYAAIGRYTAYVTATNIINLSTATTTVNITDRPIVGLQARNSSPTLGGSLTTFTATVSDGSNVVYTWDFGETFFRQSADFAVGYSPQDATVGDFNNDGLPDLATANDMEQNVSVALGKGDGTFQQRQDFDVAGRPSAIAAGDLDGDGDVDLAVGLDGAFDFECMCSGPILGILLGNGRGGFQAGPGISSGYASPEQILAADFNGDGKLDLATANGWSNSSLSVRLGIGNGTFQTAKNFSVGSRPVSLATGDFDGDGNPDLVSANAGANNLSVLRGNGDGTFQASQNFGAGSGPSSVAVGDFDGDGKPDLVTVSSAGNDVSILRGNGDGTFQARQNFAVGDSSSPKWVAVGDFDGDRKLDLVAAIGYGGSFSLLLGNGNGTLQAAQDFGAGYGTSLVVVEDFDVDGMPDVLAVNEMGGSVSVMLDDGPPAAAGSGAIVTHAYNKAGNYQATVKATNSAGTATASTGVTILAAPLSGLVAANSSRTKLGDPTVFTATVSQGSGARYQWDFGDGASAVGKTASHTYAQVGVYTVSVTATSSLNSLQATAIVTITDRPILGLALANSSPVFVDLPTVFTATVGDGSNLTFAWSFGDGESLPSGSSPTASHTYADIGTYTTTVTATNSAGSVVATKAVTVAYAPARFVSPTGEDTGACRTRRTACATIGYAVQQAVDGDTVRLAAGTYTQPAFTFPKSIGFAGESAGSTIIQAAASPDSAGDRVFYIPAGVTATIQHLTVRYGNGDGGAIRNDGILNLANASIVSNTALLVGGGIYNLGTLNVTNSTIAGNEAGNSSGGIYNNGTLNVSNSTIAANRANSGGGIYNTGALSIRNTYIANNAAGYNGGGLYNLSRLPVTISGSTIAGNSAVYGGGIVNYVGGDLALTNSTIATNNASAYGGGVLNLADFKLSSGTVAANDGGGNGGGIYNGSAATFSAKNSIVAGNKAAAGGNCAGPGTIVDGGNNLQFSPSSGCGSFAAGDPNLGPLLADNGGDTPTMALLSGNKANAAIDTGNSAGCTDFGGIAITSDQRGVSRPQGARCDIGAYEFRHDILAGLKATNSSPTGLGGTTGLTVTVSAGSGVTYVWNFGDGSAPVSGQSATANKVYAAVGSYTARVTATKGINTAVATTTVTIIDVAISGLRTANSSPTVLTEATAFTATVTGGSNVAYSWSFGDGRLGSGAQVTHTYEAKGNYVATVTATNSANVAVATTGVAVLGEIPISGLAMTRTLDVATRPSWFTATLQAGTKVTYLWDFGDFSAPAIVTTTGVSHTFAAVGTYIVRLTAMNDANAASTSAEVNILSKEIFVNGAATGANNGKSWANAYTSLATALGAASKGQEIWVAKGTYKPTTGTGRSAAFQLKSNVAVYGGFAGNESSLEQRSWKSNPTILSGRVGNYNDSDGSYHVVNGSGVNAGAVLDGFTVEKGYTGVFDWTLADDQERGAGMFVDNGSPTIRNIVFRRNSANKEGGGLYVKSGSPTLENVVFVGNKASSGDAIYSASGNTVVRNVTISGNDGGGISVAGGTTTIQNTVAWGNAGTDISFGNANQVAVSDSLVQTWTGTGSNILRADPKFVANPGGVDSGNYGDLHLQSTSPARDAGNNTTCAGKDIDGNVRARTTGDRCDMGAYEYKSSAVFNEVDGGQADANNLPLGSVVTYTISLVTAETVNGVALVDALPEGVTFEGWVQQSGAEVTGGVIAFDATTVPAGADITIIFRARLKRDPALAGTTQVNTARLTAGEADPLEAVSTFGVAKTITKIYLPIVGSIQ